MCFMEVWNINEVFDIPQKHFFSKKLKHLGNCFLCNRFSNEICFREYFKRYVPRQMHNSYLP